MPLFSMLVEFGDRKEIQWAELKAWSKCTYTSITIRDGDSTSECPYIPGVPYLGVLIEFGIQAAKVISPAFYGTVSAESLAQTDAICRLNAT